MIYKASLDKTATTITIAVTIVLCFIIGVQYPIIKETGSIIPVCIITAIIGTYTLTFLLRPLHYIVTADELIIKRTLLSVHIKKADIESALLVDSSKIKGSIRTFGVGGLFGYYGKFANFSLGSMTWYATRRDTPVLIRTKSNKKIIVTPDEPLQFIQAF